jgi:alkylhydroperoxidase family enzyme
LPPLPLEQWGDEARAALAAGFPAKVVEQLLSARPEMPMPNVLGTLMRHPGLAGPFLAYNNVLLRASVLAPRLREIMVLRVAWRTGSRYEWAQHVRQAARNKISADEVMGIPDGTGFAGWTALERELLAATDQLLDHYQVDDETWAQLAKHLDEPQLIELLFVIGTYAGLAMAFNSLKLQLDPGLDPVISPPAPNS